MLNNQEGLLKKAGQNEDVVELCNEKIRVVCDSFLALVNKDGNFLQYVNDEWVLQNFELYYDVVQAAVNKNGHALAYVNKDWAVENPKWHYGIFLAAVNKKAFSLAYVNKDWAVANPQPYYEIALAAVKKDGYVLECVNEKWLLKCSRWYYEIALAAVNQNGYAVEHVNKFWAVENSQLYYEIALVAVKKDGYALEDVHEEWVWAEENPKWYHDIVQAAVDQNGLALGYVNEEWVLDNPQQYYEIALEAVKKDGLSLYHVNHMILSFTKYEEIVLEAVNEEGLALQHVNEEWAVENLQLYYNIVIVALTQNALAFRYAGDVFRNNIKLAISSLMDLDYKCLEYKSILSKIDEMLSSPCAPRKDILLYLYMLNNKNVSNNFKNALFIFFINEFKHTLSDKFTLYKNILECYLTLSNGYKKAFSPHKLLENLSHDDSKELYMFLSVADPSVLKNSQLTKLLKNNHNDTIKNYLTKDTHNLKSIKNFNIYSSLLPKNLFAVDYNKIIKKINENNINIIKNDDLMRLVLCYFTIEDLLELSNDKLEVKYLNIDLKFHRPEGYISTGIQALVDAIKLNNGSLSNRGKYQYDTLSTTYNLLDIKPSLHNKLIEVIEFF